MGTLRNVCGALIKSVFDCRVRVQQKLGLETNAKLADDHWVNYRCLIPWLALRDSTWGVLFVPRLCMMSCRFWLWMRKLHTASPPQHLHWSAVAAALRCLQITLLVSVQRSLVYHHYYSLWSRSAESHQRIQQNQIPVRLLFTEGYYIIQHDWITELIVENWLKWLLSNNERHFYGPSSVLFLFVFFLSGQTAGGSFAVSPLQFLVGSLHRDPVCFSLHWLIRVKSKPGARRVLQIDFPDGEASPSSLRGGYTCRLFFGPAASLALPLLPGAR